SDEIKLLEMLAGETVIALKNASLYEELESRMDDVQRAQATLSGSASHAAIGELAGSVAHEINNPLTVILAHSNLLLRQLPSDAPARKRVSTIEAEATRAGKIVRDLLSFARRREAKREQVSVHELLDRGLKLLGPRLPDDGGRMERGFAGCSPPMAGDGDHPSKVFL